MVRSGAMLRGALRSGSRSCQPLTASAARARDAKRPARSAEDVSVKGVPVHHGRSSSGLARPTGRGGRAKRAGRRPPEPLLSTGGKPLPPSGKQAIPWPRVSSMARPKFT